MTVEVHPSIAVSTMRQSAMGTSWPDVTTQIRSKRIGRPVSAAETWAAASAFGPAATGP
jgi:hypothetical protein